jgi:membrane-associated protein
MPDILIPIFIYLILVVFIFSESGFFVGFFVPGDSVIFSVGLLAALGYVHIGIAIFLILLASCAGDIIGYAYGKIKGNAALSNSSLWFHNKQKKRALKLYEKYGPQTIILGRFLPMIRALLPLIAGASKLSPETFVVHNFIGIMLWISINTGAGYLLGMYVPGVEQNVIIIISMILALSFAPGFYHVVKDTTYFHDWLKHGKESYLFLFDKKLHEKVAHAFHLPSKLT